MGTISKQYKKAVGDAMIAATLKVALFKASTFVYNPDTQVVYTDIIAFECSGSGYTAGGKPIVLSGAYNGTEYTVDATDLVWGPNATIADIGFAVLYSPAGIVDVKTVSPTASVTTGTLTLQWNPSGVLKYA